jgi:hypothetical protein
VSGLKLTWGDEYFKITSPQRDNLAKQENIQILNKSITPPKWRPNINVTIISANLILWGDQNKRYHLVNGINKFTKVII